ncbi:hypothetical protein BJ138DRAFT_1151530 [Hygrophoropsis aurantiaca]|uniref:Uncharacterized protein n=1 Tax=Hygrophoropsis aurantiaca TaxID=72124 RepID=A0ACB8ACG1_9AGAM|nr:hypothetical protein BJ138DRAFT_1151530 [Hygrophoropsis aurantiaca]
MPPRTAWSAASSVPSDRIRPVQRPQSVPSSHSKGKGKTKESKSKELRRLESLAEGIGESTGRDRDPKGGCFCQAREHDLSPYVPLCHTCGLILCTINLPFYACPHCSSMILSANNRPSLMTMLEEEMSTQISREEEARAQAIEAARNAAGAFPVLPGQQPSANPKGLSLPPPPQTHKVLSLNAKTKKYTLSSYTNTPSPSRPASRAESEDDEPHRVPAPPPEPPYAKGKPDPIHPWQNTKVGSMRYIPLPHSSAKGQTDNSSGSARKSSRRNKGTKPVEGNTSTDN